MSKNAGDEGERRMALAALYQLSTDIYGYVLGGRFLRNRRGSVACAAIAWRPAKAALYVTGFARLARVGGIQRKARGVVVKGGTQRYLRMRSNPDDKGKQAAYGHA